MPLLQRDDLDIAIDYETAGSSADPAIVLLRGMGSQRLRWPPEFIAGLAAAGLFVIAPDYRDIGGSTSLAQLQVPPFGEFLASLGRGEPFSAPYRLEDLAGDILALLDHLGVDKAIVFGFSMGGYVGQILAADHPQRLAGLVSFGSSHLLPAPDKVAPEVMAVMMRGARSDSEADLLEYDLAVCRVQAGDAFPIDEPRYRWVLREERRRGVPLGSDTRQFMAILASGERTAHCARIGVPTLVLHGSADRLVPLADALRMAELVPGAETLVVEGCGHDLTPSLLPRVLPAVIDFCRRAL
ncbi:alpha/beta hydrolase [Stutzerimonas kirkiae]|uniref:Alpha/beta hydrolase n=1 Tax=Stutzerimonas kirkiae TaxID=2211392 RepID=A0A4Q9QZU6_9GAMM|nr:alpha/beta hydrolase [Stutzerimonas kirkiae]TBU90048.1 alpha/beta hydrolase [Stutzerimonas kirkiae]TBU98205.1 alpha/beta hydrolase [Stutzerimonas kirkiae]TBV10173.1 alpha/beta hydrolase [Stutzerimonas kirkiae]